MKNGLKPYQKPFEISKFDSPKRIEGIALWIGHSIFSLLLAYSASANENNKKKTLELILMVYRKIFNVKFGVLLHLSLFLL